MTLEYLSPSNFHEEDTQEDTRYVEPTHSTYYLLHDLQDMFQDVMLMILDMFPPLRLSIIVS